MRCDEARAALGHDESAEVRSHVDGCAECRAYEQKLAALGSLLDADLDREPRPGFDTRFFARLDEEKKGRERRGFLGRLGWAFAGAAAAAAGVAGVVLSRREAGAELEGDDLELAVHLELMEDLDLVRNLEQVEAFELLAEVDDLDELLEQGG